MAPILRVHVPFLKISPSKVARRKHDVSAYEAVHRSTGTQPRVMSVSTSVDYHGVSALVRFTRPHTVLGTVVFSLKARAVLFHAEFFLSRLAYAP
jgi:hypothetical protein